MTDPELPPVDVAIVGGGPAGLHAAQLLARSGLSVRVLEEHARIGAPVHCTGIVGAEAFALPGVPGTAVLASPRAARFRSPVGHRLPFVGPAGAVCVVDRGVFDAELAAAARRAGAEVVTGARVVAVDAGAGGVTVRARAADGTTAETSAAVGVLACGAAYRFQRHLGWGVPRLSMAAVQTEVAAAPSEELEIFFRRELPSTGFGWIVPIRRDGEPRAKVGVMGRRHVDRALQGLLADLAAEGRVDARPGPTVTRLLPLGPLERTYGERVLAIGDAAGLVKPTTGGGIYYSLLSAGWAADTIARAFERGDFSAAALAGYEETWRAHLGQELSVGVWFRRLAARLCASDIDALTALAISDGVMPIISRTARFNRHRDLIRQTLRHPGVLQIVARRLLAAVVGPLA